jgi:hypothetical protein
MSVFVSTDSSNVTAAAAVTIPIATIIAPATPNNFIIQPRVRNKTFGIRLLSLVLPHLVRRQNGHGQLRTHTLQRAPTEPRSLFPSCERS